MISACLIVKDEELLLPGCLQTLSFVDEIVAIDTGSSDRTCDILETYGARIFHSPWTDYATHRNEAFDMAEGEWFVVIDADERIVNHTTIDFEKLRGHQVGYVHVVDQTRLGATKAQFVSPRIFHTSSHPSYIHTIHNEATFTGDSVQTNITYVHFGYDLPPPKKQAKFDRRMEQLLALVDENPYDQRAMFYITNTLLGGGQLEPALAWGEKCLNLGVRPPYDHLLTSLGHIAFQLHFFQMAEAYWKRSLEVDPTDIDAAWYLAHLGKVKFDDRLRATYTEKYDDLYAQYQHRPHMAGSRFIYTATPQHKEALHARSEELHERRTEEIL